MSVPPGHDFYTVTVARRGERNYNKTPPYLRQTWETDGFNQLLKNSMEWGLGSEK